MSKPGSIERLVEAVTSSFWAVDLETMAVIRAVISRETDPEAVEFSDTRPSNSGKIRMSGSVAIIDVIGPIYRYANIFTEISGATSIQNLAKSIDEAVNDPGVSAIVFNIDSPGGEVNGLNEAADAIFAARKIKPTFAYVGGKAASGGYWLAAAAETIVVDATAMLGSIGVVSTIRRAKSDGDDVLEIVNSDSPDKRFDPSTDEGRKKVLATVNSLAEVFFSKVGKFRGVSRAFMMDNFGKGGVLIGETTVKVSMADMVGSFESTLKLAKGGDDMPDVNKEMLAKDHPDLLADLQAEADKTAAAKYEAKLQEVKKAQFTASLAARIGEKRGQFLAGLSDRLTDAEMEGLAVMLEKSDKVITETGKVIGSDSTTVKEPTVAEEAAKVKAYAEEHKISQTDALIALEMAKAKK